MTDDGWQMAGDGEWQVADDMRRMMDHIRHLSSAIRLMSSAIWLLSFAMSHSVTWHLSFPHLSSLPTTSSYFEQPPLLFHEGKLRVSVGSSRPRWA